MNNRDEPSRPDRRFWRKAPTANVADEVAFHLQSAIDEGLAAGLSADAARAAALQRFGDVERVSAELRHLAVRGEQTLYRREWLEGVVQDARHGLRQLRASPGFTLIALLTLALGIGANTAIFSLVDSVMLRPLGFADPSRLYDLRPLSPEGDAHYNVAFPNYLAWSTGTRLFAAIGGTTNQSFTLTGAGAPQRLTGLRASATYWQALESPPVAGRYFTQAEDRVGGPRVVVISHALFVNAFGSDPGVVGRAILLDGLPFTVIGIAPDTYAPIANGAALWVPLAITTRESQMYGDHEMVVTGRLRPGVSLDAGLAELRGFERDIQHIHPDDGFTGKVVGRPAVEALVGHTAERQFLVLLGAVGLVLLIACGNVANLLLARAVSRRGEIAIRNALGANRRRIVAQMLVESGVLTMGGALLGVAAGAIILRVLVASAPAGIPRLADATINGRVLLFTMVVAIVAGLLFGVVPAWRASQTDLQATLRASGRDGRTGNDPLRGALVIAEIAVALVLLTAAGLLIRSSMAMQREATGFDASSLLTTRVALPIAQYGDLSVGGTYARILDGVRAIPGVTSAAMISRMPIGAGGADCMVTAPGITPAGDDGRDAQFRSVSPDYFHTIGTPILRGRAIDATDMTSGPLVAVINARLAHSLFGDRDPIGRQILHCIGINDGYQHTAARTVIGVAADVRANGLDNDFVDQVYYPYTQFFERTAALLIRAPGNPAALMPGIRRAVAAVDPTLPLFRTATMDAIVHDSTASPRFTMLLLILLGGTGLLLAAIGIYGVIAYQVGQRTREIGVRLALGATPGSVWSLVVRQAMTVALAGVLAGELLALVAARALSGLIYGVAPSDPLTFTSMGVILTGTALVASLVPAVRATRIDPIRALRS